MQNLEFNEEDLWALTDKVLLIGQQLLRKLDNLADVNGVKKLQRKITQELKFLEKAKGKKSLKINQLMCSNLIHYEYFVEVLMNQKEVTHVDCIFPLDDISAAFRVDIVCEKGHKWLKVIARNSKSLNDAAKGRAGFGAKSIVDQAQQYINAASRHHCVYRPPEVVFHFRHEIDDELADVLKNMGIEMQIGQNRVPNQIDSCKVEVNVLNVDVSTMIALVSSLTNGGSSWIFQEGILTSQACAERKSPVKGILDKLFEGKRLICCETAAASFQDIISLLGGSEERKRATELLKRVEIYPDITDVPLELAILKPGGKIKERSLKIFAFGYAMKAVTVTSNEGFIRSAKMQGIHFEAIVHEARALTEQKEGTATSLEMMS